jgi:hypothetical protein
MKRSVAIVLVCGLALARPAVVVAAEAQRPLLVEYVSPSLLSEPAEPTPAAVARPEAEEFFSRRLGQRGELTAGERWEKFEAEFGIQQRESSLLRASVQSAKYQLDRAVFAMQEIVDTVESALEFDYPIGRWAASDAGRGGGQPRSSNPLQDALLNARLQSDIDLSVPTGRAFVGVKLVLPVGR